MKKGIKKLRLHRETLLSLTDLGIAVGGITDNTRCGTQCIDGCDRTDNTCTQCSNLCTG